jgi:tyrosine-protein phosphatase YwqE
MIWPFAKQKRFDPKDIAPEGLFDAHLHLLWGMDDGPSNRAGTIEILDGLHALGYVRVAATPHQNPRMFPLHGLQEIETAIADIAGERGGIGPEIVAGSEIMFDDSFMDDLENGSLPRLGAGNAYLVEFGAHPGAIPNAFEETVFRLQTREIAIVIAHAERHYDLQQDQRRVDLLRKGGAMIQIDLMSLIGGYGRNPMKTAWRFLENGSADLVSTDLHSAAHMGEIARSLSELAEWDEAELVRLASTNPRLILAGDPWEIERHE